MNIMDYIPYTLKDFIKNNKLTEEIRVDLINQLLDAFEYLHNHSILHRDISFTNIMIKENPKESLLEMFSMLSIEDDNKKAKDRISLLTIHKSKGLEFKCVIIIGCNEGIIPPLNISNEAKAEERRLLYVAITRAREILYITSSQLHYLNDFKRRYQPSSFLLETGLFGTPLKKDYYYN